MKNMEKELNRKQKKAIIILEIQFGIFKGVSSKDDPYSAAIRDEYQAKLLKQLSRLEELGLRRRPEVERVVSKMKYHGLCL